MGARPSAEPERAVAVAIAATMKVGTATSERSERRESPHRPCPDVQPLANAVPRPTRSPAIATRGEGEGRISKDDGRREALRTPPPQSPARKLSFVASRGPTMSDLTAPLFPAIRPVTSMYTPAAQPINSPPTTASSGRKARACIASSAAGLGDDEALARGRNTGGLPPGQLQVASPYKYWRGH